MSGQIPPYGWRLVESRIDSQRWDVDEQLIRRDGYEIYIYEDSFEIARRNPETFENEVIFERQSFDITEPASIAMLLYVLDNIETIIQEIINDS